ncbi:MAG TPA: hypothetical protein PKY12_04820 [Catalimonadaceae bacterium]|jgi:hypothetical protein|nr:hypothetical protein [Catalimonadaceae bacterium]
MTTRKLTRTGLLLLLTAGPFLVFLFLYVFGKNQYVVDTYPIQLKIAKSQSDKEIKILLPASDNLELAQKKQIDRISSFISDSGIEPGRFYYTDSMAKADSQLALWVNCDTILPIQTAKGPSLKELPGKPRIFLMDEQNQIRGVYNLSSSLSVDTLMLELTILSKK